MSSHFSFAYSSCYYLCLLLLLFPLCFSNQNYDDDVLCIDGEKQALLKFKYGLVDEANKLASWDDDASDCVDGLELFVTMLLFGGFVPPQLGNLSELNVLSLGRFDHDGVNNVFQLLNVRNMQWLSSLHRLHYLNMSGINLCTSNDWLQVINALPSLEKVHLSDCQVAIRPLAPGRNITSLTLLDLSYNDIDSSMGQWIFSIHSLVSLDLSQCNYLDGTLLRSIDSYHNLTSLKYLYVSMSDFGRSSLVLEGLSKSIGSNLISLDISSSRVTSSNIDSLHNLTSIRRLDLSNNQLNKTLRISLGNFCNLREINLSNNDFSEVTLASLFQTFFDCKFPLLESFSMKFSGVYGHLPNQIGQLIHLVHRRLSWNNISGTIPDFKGRLSSLRSLDLGRNRISGRIPNSMGRLSSLEMLDLSSNQLIGSPPDSLGQLMKLNYLDFSSNLLTGVMTETHFTKLANLKYLSGNGNNITLRPSVANWIPPFKIQYLYLSSWILGPQFPLSLQMQTSLIELNVSNTCISSPMPHSVFRSFPNIRILDMSKNHIQGKFLWFDIPATIRSLDLSSNEFRGNLPDLSNGSVSLLLDLSNNFLEVSLHRFLCCNVVKGTLALILGNNNLSGVIPECWNKWPQLFLLNLENNNLSGKIPRTLGFLVSLFALNMDGNKLSGTLPDSLMNLTNLVILQLGRNELEGNIPSGFGKLSHLSLLNLRSNNFDGHIPRELCNPKYIQILDLANNNLSGDIPRCFNKYRVLTGEAYAWGTFTLPSINMSKEIFTTESLVMKGREDTYSNILGLVMLLDLSNNSFSGNIPSE
ncbi:uncharacterized protein [Rutidosis leptorrhynchoides]|uniref:uncharacterized protein n=1 Tax=Rutidosis leptorrhynchoides TaxID=125765 RepID=UPI003A98CFD0